MRSYGLKRVMDQLFSSARMSFMKVLNIIPYLRLELVGSMDSNIYFPPDGFGALEENLLTGKNIYFEARARNLVLEMAREHLSDDNVLVLYDDYLYPGDPPSHWP
jgi:hypothetical protein